MGEWLRIGMVRGSGGRDKVRGERLGVVARGRGSANG